MDSKHNAENPPIYDDLDSKEKKDVQRETKKTPSLETLISWNISKALKSNPGIDLKVALREAEERLDEAYDAKALVSPDARNLCCALLAWQQLGHRRADSLFNFIKTVKEEEVELERNTESLYERSSYENDNPNCSVISPLNVPGSKNSSRTPCQWGSPTKMDFSTSIGLVVNLPREPQMLMQCLSGPVRVPKKSNRSCSCVTSNNIIDSACCLDKKCMERLTSMEAETLELRKRAGQFARRETQRAEQLERAEMTWRDLDACYQRRLRVAKEKEEEYEKQMARVLDDRNKYKQACMPLVDALKKKSSVAEKEQEKLKQLEKEVCSRACAHVQLAENASRVSAQLTEQQCKCSQLDRNLAWKEEHERSKQRALEDAAEVAKVLTHEAECAQRAELEALRRQVVQASQDLLEEDARTELLKKRIEDYMQEKNEMIEDLEACQTKCEGRMGGLVKDLKCKRDKLAELKDKMMECRCKEPVDQAVEVKRTPSLAALCKCSPSNTIQGSCSCASIRSRLLSSLLKDLFNGLKSEMEDIGSQMPCHLLKCLEDKHNWDQTTDVKQNVRAYFSRLLLGELDIAIATVIEKSHAQWVGECCVDMKMPQVSRDSKHSLRWQEHELEMKTQKLANELAEKMFREKAKELARQAQQELKDSRPPCECDLNDKAQYSSALYRCLVHPYPNCHMNKMKNSPVIVATSQVQRKNNLIPQITQNRSSKIGANGTAITLPKYLYPTNKIGRKDVNNRRPESILTNKGNACKPATTRRTVNITARKLKSCTNKANPHKVGVNGPNKLFKEPQQYAVNMCLCDYKKESTSSKPDKNFNMELELCHRHRSVSDLRQPKPILDFRETSFQKSDKTSFSLCTKKCACLHKTPSNTSIDRLVNVLTKWKDNLVEKRDCNIQEIINTDSLFKITHSSIVNILQEIHNKTHENECKNSKTTFEKCAETQQHDKNVKSLKESKKTLDKEDECPKAIVSSQMQKKQSKLLIAINLNDALYHCDNNVKTIKSNTNRPLPIMPSVKSVPVKADIRKKSIENSFPIKSKINLDNYDEIDTSINKNNNAELKLPVTNIAERSAVQYHDGEKCIQCLGATLANAMRKHSLNKNDNNILDVKQRNSNNLSTLNIKEIGDVAKFPAGNTHTRCQNYIQFLGVALNNSKVNRLLKRDAKKSRNQKSYKRHHRGNLLEDKQGNSHDKSNGKLVKLSTNRDILKTRYAINRIKALNVLHVHNECVYSRTKVENVNEDKSVEVQNINNDVLSSDEHCVCCPITKADNINDLEVNAFQLLEEHLKSKLDEFRCLASKSSCIPNVDEKSILVNTILKVKKLIMESANKVTCKCGGNKQSSSGSWNRAYGLLHEYLKTKIEHVKCICSSVEYSRGENIGRDENLVTSVLSQISCLIENDLQRLKNICKCNDTTLDTISKQESHITHEPQCSISDLKNHNNMIITNAIEISNMPMTQMVESKFVTYTNDVSLPHNKSAQVLLHHSVETKSCDALKLYSKCSEVQTLDVMKTKLDIDNYTNSESDDVKPSTNQQDNDSSTKKAEKKSNLHPDIQNNRPTKDTTLFQKRDITVLPIVMSPGYNINENGSKKNNLIDDQLLYEKKLIHGVNEDDKINEPFLENIGCTLNCCCDRDLGCVCTKSTIPSNTEWFRINDIFKTFSQKQSVVENVSYILKSIPNKIPTNVDSIEDHSEDVYVMDKVKINNLNRSESNDERNIYFGGYKQKVHVVNDYYKELVHESKTKERESGANASEEDHIYLKQSNQRFDTIHFSANTLTDESSLQFNSLPSKSKHHGILKQNAHELFKHVPMSFSNSDTSLIADHESQRSKSLSTDCDCAMVPMCHVKMLVENIGNKLVKAECTCDSLKSVCPIHS